MVIQWNKDARCLGQLPECSWYSINESYLIIIIGVTQATLAVIWYSIFPENERGPDRLSDLSEVTQPVVASCLPGKLVQEPLSLTHKLLAPYGHKGAAVTKDLKSPLNQSHREFYLEVLGSSKGYSTQRENITV